MNMNFVLQSSCSLIQNSKQQKRTTSRILCKWKEKGKTYLSPRDPSKLYKKEEKEKCLLAYSL